MIAAVLISTALLAGTPDQVRPPDQVRTDELAGLWKAKRRFGPDMRGRLLITRSASGYSADMMGFTVPVALSGNELTFELPNGGGAFRGKPQPNGTIRGFWFSAPRGQLGPASPVTLHANGGNRWSGDVVPVDDVQTFYLLVSKRADGTYAALLRNLERDFGGLLGIRGLVHTGSQVGLVGRLGTQPPDSITFRGAFDSVRQVMTINIPQRGGTYDFRRDDDAYSDFYPRGKSPARYVYRVPPTLDDGWPTASVDDVGIDRAAVERAVQQIVDMSMDSINAPQVHSVLIVRGGKLVLEEYFHGEHRNRPHNTRSGSKSVTATIAGAAMLAGAPLKLSTPVYQLMNGGEFPPDLEPRKRAMTLEHLLTMSSGYFCDDSNNDAPGNEDGMWDQQDEPDFYRFTLKLPMAFAPGERAIYCSINPNLALGMVARATGESPLYLFDRLVAAPLGINDYIWALDRARNPYGGGGMGLTARDFIKFGQLMLKGGVWQGHRVLSEEFVTRASSPLVKINQQRPYGLAWWIEEKQHNGRAVQSYAALGNGGQIVMVFPELDLVVATSGGSYGSRGWRWIGGELISNLILPAVR